jgi:hypothetical protein
MQVFDARVRRKLVGYAVGDGCITMQAGGTTHRVRVSLRRVRQARDASRVRVLRLMRVRRASARRTLTFRARFTKYACASTFGVSETCREL